MSLERYSTDRRVVVLSSDATAYEAARAMDDNHVGAVLVQDHGRLVGILTDRDLALRVAGSGFEASELDVGEVMSTNVIALPVEASVDDVVECMLERHVRRVPIVQGGKVVGLVSLDDLILTGDADLETLAEIVKAQLSEPRREKPSDAVHPVRVPPEDRSAERQERHQSRSGRTLSEFSKHLSETLGIEDRGRALTAFEVVATALVERLTPDEARDFLSQLPSLLRERLEGVPKGPDPHVTRESVETDMALRLDLEPEEAAALVRRVAVSMEDFVSEAEVEDIIAQLPRDMKELFVPPP
jgi:CBS domain-containing protein/uncharacterized protein (DUF2267 family)